MSFVRILMIVAFLPMLSSCKCKDEKEIRTWKYSKKADPLCPALGSYPVFFKKKPKMRYASDLKKAMARWNRVSQEMWGGKFFEDFSNLNKYTSNKSLMRKVQNMYKNGQISKWPPVAVVQDAEPSEKHFRGNCAYVMIGENIDFIQARSIAYMKFLVSEVGSRRFYSRANIFLCSDKYEKAIRMMGSRLGQKIKEMGMYGVLLHELGHILLGRTGGLDGGHPSLYGQIMSRSPGNHAISYHTKELIRHRVVASCKRAGLLFKP